MDLVEQRAVVEKFMAAVTTGDVRALVAVLAPDVVAVADGGGLAPAARRPVTGADRVAALLVRAAATPDFAVCMVWLNGSPGIRVEVGGGTVAVSLTVADGRVTGIYAIANPRKLCRLNATAELRR